MENLKEILEYDAKSKRTEIIRNDAGGYSCENRTLCLF